jgi:polysaccharide pyruvyl transferase WcaK-like protein
MLPAIGSPMSPRIAIWGTFDVANYGDLLFPRIFEHEVTRRLPGAAVRSFSPLGDRHPIPLSGGFDSEPLGRWTPQRAAQLADELDFVAIGGGEIIHTHDELYGIWYEIPKPELEGLRPSDFFIDGVGRDNEPRCPTAWHGVGIPFDFDDAEAARVRAALADRCYVSVRDELSRDRLARAGVDREIHVVPDSAFVLDRLMTPELIAKRVGFLRSIEAYPTDERPLVVQGSNALMPFVDDIGTALRDLLRAEASPPPIVLLDTGPCNGDAEFAEAIAPYFDRRPYRVSEGTTVDDIAAAIACSRGFIGLSLHGNLTAFVYGLPSAILNLVAYSKLDAFSTEIGPDALVSSKAQLGAAVRRVLAGARPDGDRAALVARVDSHFDALAELAELAAWERGAPLDMEASVPAAATRFVREAQRRYELLMRAHMARGRRLVEERLRFAEIVNGLEMGQGTAELEARIAETEAARAATEAQLAERTAQVQSVTEALERLQATKLMRYSASLRRVYARLRRLG